MIFNPDLKSVDVKIWRQTAPKLNIRFDNDRYKDFLSSYLFLEDNETHQVILEDLKEKIDKGMDVDKALNRVMAKHHADFLGLFQHDGSGTQIE